MYIDFHTHILPGIDDGSRNPAQSKRMLSLSKEQGVITIVGTPHFDPISMDADQFLIKREYSLSLLLQALEENGIDKTVPQLLCGAECKYIKRISKYPDIRKLCIEGTSYLLLELPYGDWDEDIFEELYLLSVNQGIFPILAHPDRFFNQIKKLNAMDKFAELDCLMQINADSLNRLLKRRDSFYLLSGSVPCVLGSDIHSDDPDEPMLSRCVKIIEQRFGENIIEKIFSISKAVLQNEKPSVIKEIWW